MKNIFRFLMAVAVLFTASCAKEDISSSIGGGEVEVTFTANLPELGTRAYGEGEHATTLKFFVYEYENENVIGKYLPDVKIYKADNEEGTNVITSTNKHFDFSLTLIKGMKYNIVFWADKGEYSPYSPVLDTNGAPTGVIKANYSDVYANDDSLDAFFGSLKNFDPAAADAQSRAGSIELKRPFAQLNAKTTDLTEIQRSGATLFQSALAVKAYTTLDLFSGNVGGLDEDNAVVFKPNSLPDSNGHISMNYLLAPTTKCTADVTLSYTFVGANVDFPATTYSYVPLQRNYRTNIIGKLLTAATDFSVEIKPAFDEPAVDGPIVTTQREFNAAIAAGEKLIYFTAGNFTIPAQFNVASLSNGTTLTLIGAGAETKLSFNSVAGGTDGGLNSYADGLNLEFKNMTIVSPNTGSAYTGGFGRALSATFTNCEYYGQYRAVNANTKFEKCTIDPQTSYIYTDYANVDFVDCVFNCSKGKAIQVYNDGASTNTTINVKNCQFTAAEIGYTWDDKPVTAIDINSDGELFTVNINNSTATGFGTGLQSGNNLYNIKGGANYIIINVDGVCVSAYGLAVVDGYAALFKNDEGDYYLLNKQSLIDWHNFLDANKAGNPYKCNVKMLANIDADGWTWESLWIIPDSGNTTGFQFDGQNHTISNLKIAGEGLVAGGLTGMAFKDLTINGVEVESTGHNAAVFAGSTYSNVSFENVAVKNATVNGLCNTGIFVGGTYEPNNLVVSFKNCSVETSAITAAGKNGQDPTGASGFVGKAYGSTKLVFEGTNSIDDATTITNLNGLVGGKAYGYTVLANGDWAGTGASDELVSWGGLSYISDGAALTEALKNGLSVVLNSDIDFGSTQLAITGENQVVDLGGHALTTANNWGGISLKNGAVIKNGTITHSGNTAAIKAFNGCSVENVTINATSTAADKTITGIAVQQGANVESIKNVTINGVSQGIEVGYQATVGLIEKAVVNENNNGTAKGIGLVINGGMVGKAKDCTFKGETYGITLHLKGVFAAGLELENCTVEGATASIYAWDEKGISNTSGSLVLTYDAATTLTGPFVWDFEDECKSVVTLNQPK